MARKSRIHYPGALYHVILRGNAGDTVFFDEVDRCRFYLLLQEGTEGKSPGSGLTFKHSRLFYAGRWVVAGAGLKA